MRTILAATALLLALAIAGPAVAQDMCGDASESCSLGVAVSSSTTIGAIGATTLSQIRRRQRATLDLYLRHNTPAFVAALALGGGGVFDDLAWALEVPLDSRAQFGAELRRNRRNLVMGLAHEDTTGYLEAVSTLLKVARTLRTADDG